MLKLFSFYNSDSLLLYTLILVFVAGSLFYLFKFRKELISPANLKFLLAVCGTGIILLLIFNYIKDNPSGDVYYTRFKDAGTLSKGSNVIYRGVNVGRVTRVAITPDSQFAEIEFIISDKNTRIPVNSYVEMSFRSITDMQPLIIKPPAHTDKYEFIATNTFIKSKESFAVEETQKLIARMIEEGRVEEIINDMSQLVKNSADVSKNLNTTLKETTDLVKSVKSTNANINKVLQNGDLSKDIKTTVTNANVTVKKFEHVADKTDAVIDKSQNMIDSIQNTVDNVDSNINDKELHANLQESAKTLKEVLSDLQEISGDSAIKGHIKNSIAKSSEISSRANCLSEGFTQIMGKRFLLPRLLLGKFGQSANQCSEQVQLEMQEINDSK